MADKVIYFDCFAGASGDMIVGALLDLGVDPEALARELRKLPVSGYRLEFEQAVKGGLRAQRFKVMLAGIAGEQLADAEFQELDEPVHSEMHHPHPDHSGHGTSRSLADILAIIGDSELEERVKDRAQRIFLRLGSAEAHAHGTTLEAVHLHEVGGIDAIVDVVSAVVGLELLGVEAIYVSPLHLGSGFVRFSHGVFPVPAPATAYLVAGVPVYSTGARGELLTPTGAAILTTLADGFGPLPPFIIQRVGYGAGTRDREFPNALRAYLGEQWEGPLPTIPQAPTPLGSMPIRSPFPQQHDALPNLSGYHESPAVVLEANIDDMNPQWFGHLMDRLLAAGALDVAMIPIQMKKNRPGVLVQVLSHPDGVDPLLAILFTESTTLGVRTYDVTKRMLQRESAGVETPLGPVRVKIARLGDRLVNASPEYEDLLGLSRQYGLPLKEVYAIAQEAIYKLLRAG